ncbi:hypothetical protein L873DRAFT_1811665 [Choiromyces venosus 120613-1]|uniref:Uncharacterized protein n=1 Tax=Choiromyces venosus 120613-1 TaxID=1336337 RepID=A0A3N4JG42_9PEZI|nr:hypothetical protein L873DRAFT_1811665 [Choiromyces venosus 120613-1]
MTLPFWPATASQLPHNLQSTLPVALDRYLIISSFFRNFGVSHPHLSLFATNHILTPLVIPKAWDLC